ncbi:MAG: hypothetical protein V3V74_07185 [Nitrosomonadaceae bacterium]
MKYLLVVLIFCFASCRTLEGRLRGTFTHADKHMQAPHDKVMQSARTNSLQKPIPYMAELRKMSKNCYRLELHWLADKNYLHGILVKDLTGKSTKVSFRGSQKANVTNTPRGVHFMEVFFVEASYAMKLTSICFLDDEQNRCSDFVDVTRVSDPSPFYTEDQVMDFSEGKISGGSIKLK